MSAKEIFVQQLRSSFPGLKNEPLQTLVSDNLISPFTVELPSSVLSQAQEVVQSIFTMRELPEYQAKYTELLTAKDIKDPGNKSIMMSYDFHLDENHDLKLIEINTNAAFLILGHEMYLSKGVPLPVADFSLVELKNCIETEMALQGKEPKVTNLAIIDDKPESQRLYVEFLAYNELFKSWGWDSRILDYRETFRGFAPDFIYNRHTDFFLNDPGSAELKAKFLDRSICLSPNPFEYLLLADKQRMIDWHSENFLTSIPLSQRQREVVAKATPLAYDVCSAKAEEIWNLRKKLFFKPKNAFGSKQSYRGSSISSKAFQDLLNENMIAQEFVAAPEREFETPEGPQKFKFDLRCYAYQGRLQLVVARIYQGQVTNLRTPYGGFAPVKFT